MSEQEPIKSVSKPGETKVLITSTVVRGVDIYHFPSVSDPRGDLTVGELDRGFPFRPKRYFIISGVHPARFAESMPTGNVINF